ncbi:MAG: hypothetical protein QW416_01285 [Candidatus Nitrosocaldaceae archaeon]
MEIELEFASKVNDKAEILTKLVDVIKIAEQQGFSLKEIELEDEEDK